MSPKAAMLLARLIRGAAKQADAIGTDAGYAPDEEDPIEYVDSILGKPEESTSYGMIQKMLSDEDLKDIDEETGRDYLAGLFRHKKKLTPRDMKILKQIQKHQGGWDDDILNKYAENIKNYSYQYKEEAKQLDPSIDPNTEHIGPMAQDIEKVNPAAIIKDGKTGYLSVDTGRLALMNAGAIAELARELKGMKND